MSETIYKVVFVPYWITDLTNKGYSTESINSVMRSAMIKTVKEIDVLLTDGSLNEMERVVYENTKAILCENVEMTEQQRRTLVYGVDILRTDAPPPIELTMNKD